MSMDWTGDDPDPEGWRSNNNPPAGAEEQPTLGDLINNLGDTILTPDPGRTIAETENREDEDAPRN